MLDITKPIILNVTKPNNQTVVYGKQGDFNTRYIHCTLVDGYNNPIFIKPHYVVTINAKRGEEAKSFLCEVISDGTIKAPLTSWMLSTEGTLKCEIAVFTPDNQRLASACFNLVVQEAVYLGDDIQPDENYSLLISLMGAVSAAKESANHTAILSQSWAVGGTGMRQDENENNAKYFKESAEQFANVAANNILNGVNAHDASGSAHPDIREEIRNVEAIARGKATAYVFDTYQEMQTWVNIPENKAKLVVGDNLYIRDTSVKDYWWDGEQPCELEAEAPDLSNYYTREQVEAMLPQLVTRSEYNALVENGLVQAGKRYDIIEDE